MIFLNYNPVVSAQTQEKTFSEEYKITKSVRKNFNLAINSKKNIYISYPLEYSEDNGYTNVYQQIYGSKTYKYKNLATTSSSKIVIDNEDNLHIISPGLTNRSVGYMKLNSKDKTIIKPSRLIDYYYKYTSTWEGNIIERLNFYDLITDNNNSVHIIFIPDLEESEKHPYYIKIGSNGTCLESKFLFNTSAFNPIINLDQKGDLHLTWHGSSSSNFSQRIYFLKLSNSGEMLVKDKIIFSGFYPTGFYKNYAPLSQSMTIIEDNIYVLYVNSNSPNETLNLYLKKFDLNGKSIGKEIQLTNTTSNATNPKITIDTKSNFHIIWIEDSKVNYKKLNKNLTTIEDKIMSNSSSKAVYSQLLVDNEDGVHILWSIEKGLREYEIYYKTNAEFDYHKDDCNLCLMIAIPAIIIIIGFILILKRHILLKKGMNKG